MIMHQLIWSWNLTGFAKERHAWGLKMKRVVQRDALLWIYMKHPFLFQRKGWTVHLYDRSLWSPIQTHSLHIPLLRFRPLLRNMLRGRNSSRRTSYTAAIQAALAVKALTLASDVEIRLVVLFTWFSYIFSHCWWWVSQELYASVADQFVQCSSNIVSMVACLTDVMLYNIGFCYSLYWHCWSVNLWP